MYGLTKHPTGSVAESISSTTPEVVHLMAWSDHEHVISQVRFYGNGIRIRVWVLCYVDHLPRWSHLQFVEI